MRSALPTVSRLSAINLNHPGRYVHWGVIQISVANLLLILLMVVIFAAAILIPFRNEATEVTAAPAGTATPGDVPATTGAPEETGGWTGWVRRRALRSFPPDQLLPDKQPIYVASWIYVFGVATIAAFIVVLATGGILALRGPAWWHTSSVGHYVNSTHLWSVELFMAFMVIHLWGKFFMAAWRGKRALTWITGAVSFIASIGTAFTGYLTQQNLASQWVSTQAKDGLNSVGIGAYFNVLDFGQMLM